MSHILLLHPCLRIAALPETCHKNIASRQVLQKQALIWERQSQWQGNAKCWSHKRLHLGSTLILHPWTCYMSALPHRNLTLLSCFHPKPSPKASPNGRAFFFTFKRLWTVADVKTASCEHRLYFETPRELNENPSLRIWEKAAPQKEMRWIFKEHGVNCTEGRTYAFGGCCLRLHVKRNSPNQM